MVRSEVVECRVEGCMRDASRRVSGKRGMCQMHYARWRTHGDPSVVKRTPSPAKDWIAAHKDYSGDDCLKWPFHIGADGYGRVHRFNNGQITTASRFMCEVAHGDPPSRIHETAHSCGRGNLGCVNPRHLYWATPAQNHADKIAHGTTNRGERQGAHKLTEEDVRKIRELVANHSQAALALMFDVHPSHICKVLNGQRWEWME